MRRVIPINTEARCIALVGMLVLLGASAPIWADEPASFTGVGVLDGDTSSTAYSVSRDGNYVTGGSWDGTGPQAFIYDASLGTKEGISWPTDWSTSIGYGVDHKAAGTTYVTGEGLKAGVLRAFFYDSSASPAFTEVPLLTGGTTNYGRAVQCHFNGDVMTTGTSSKGGGLKDHAYRWRINAPGASLDLGDTETGDDNYGHGECIGFRADGNTVIRGSSETHWAQDWGGGGHTPCGFSWHSGSSFNYCLWWTSLDTSYKIRSHARGTSKEGRYVVGSSTFDDSGRVPGGVPSFSESNRMAYLLDGDDGDLYDSCAPTGGTNHGPLEYCVRTDYGTGGCWWGSRLLGWLEDHENYSEAYGVSAKGSTADEQVVVGRARLLTEEDEWGEDYYVAFIWDNDNGMRDLKTVLTSAPYNLDLTGWELREAKSISTDGTVICGLGHHTDAGLGIDRDEGWVATIGTLGPTNACCRADTLLCDDTTLGDCSDPDVYHVGEKCVDVPKCCPVPFANSDAASGDTDVDQVDFAAFQVCWGVSAASFELLADECKCWDRDKSGAIGLSDYTDFINCFTGPNVPFPDPPPGGCTPDWTP